jgi:hypothetical protein
MLSTTLFEFNTGPETAGNRLQVLTTFWQNPEDVDAAIDALERVRLQRSGE